MISRDLLKLGNKLRLINVARGELVDESAVIQALKSRNLLSYTTDVIANEQDGCRNSILWKASFERDDIFLTPVV